MEFTVLWYVVAALKLTLAISPLLVIFAIFAVNKNWNQRSSDGARRGLRSEYIDSEDEDDKKNDWWVSASVCSLFSDAFAPLSRSRQVAEAIICARETVSIIRRYGQFMCRRSECVGDMLMILAENWWLPAIQANVPNVSLYVR